MIFAEMFREFKRVKIQMVFIQWLNILCQVAQSGMVICLQRGANDLHMAELMPLPPHHLLLQ